MTPERRAVERLLFLFLGLLAAVGVMVWLLPEIWDKLSPFIISIPLAAMLQPVVRFLQRRLKMKRGLASLLPVLLLLILFLFAVYYLFSLGIGQVIRIMGQSAPAEQQPGDISATLNSAFVTIITDNINAVTEALNRLISGISESVSPSVAASLRDSLSNLTVNLTDWGISMARAAVAWMVSFAASMPYAIIYISFLTIGLYFITENYAEIRSYLPGGSRRNQDSNTTRLSRSAIRSLTGYLRVQLTFGLIVWIVSWIYLGCFGFPYSALLALFAGFMELIPMIGSGALYFVISGVQFLLGNTDQGLQILFLTLGLQLLRRVLEPKLMSDSIGISPLQSLIGMFVGMRIGGIPGLVGGPVFMAVLVGAWRANLHRTALQDIRTLVTYFRERWKDHSPAADDPAAGEPAPPEACAAQPEEAQK